jgi:prophage DNA circulation protein
MPVDNNGTTAFDGFPKAYFTLTEANTTVSTGPGTSTYSEGRIYFPVESSRIEGGIRDHLHKYPHSPGSSPEKLGRESYLFHVTSKFDTSYTTVGYPGLYPTALNNLISAFENQATGAFRLPQMGAEVQCYARKWTREMSNKVRSGETVEFTMVEDQTTSFVAANIVDPAISVASSAAAMNANAAVQSYLSTATTKFTNLFTAMNSAVTQFLAVKDTVGLYDQVINATAAQISNQCEQLDDMLGWQGGQADVVYQVMEQLHVVWAAALQYQQDQTSQGVVLQQWTVAATTDIATLSASIYNGDTTRASDLLSLNVFPDPMMIPAGFTVEYYP